MYHDDVSRNISGNNDVYVAAETQEDVVVFGLLEKEDANQLSVRITKNVCQKM